MQDPAVIARGQTEISAPDAEAPVLSWHPTAGLALIVSIALPLVAVAQPVPGSRDAPSGDVWISDEQYPPLTATARQMQPRASDMPTGDVWPSPEGAIETAQQAPTGP